MKLCPECGCCTLPWNDVGNDEHWLDTASGEWVCACPGPQSQDAEDAG